jgi:hypothetical protein
VGRRSLSCTARRVPCRRAPFEICKSPRRPSPPLPTDERRSHSAEVKFPQSLRISGLVPIKMSALQELAIKHTLPAIELTPMSMASLPVELRERQAALSGGTGGTGNEELYAMFAKSLEHRGNVRLLLFPLVVRSLMECSI